MTDKEADVSAEVRKLLDQVHALQRETIQNVEHGQGDTVRICLDVPRAWLLLAWWLERTEQLRRDGRFTVMQAGIDPTEYERAMRDPARRFLGRMLDSDMHLELHDLATGGHRYLSPPAPAVSAVFKDDDDGIPF